MSAHTHTISFPLAWMDVGRMIADDLKKKKVPHTSHTNYNMISYVLYFFFSLFSVSSEGWIFILDVQTFLSRLCDYLSYLVTHYYSYGTYRSFMSNLFKDHQQLREAIQRRIVLCTPITNCSNKMPPMQVSACILSSLVSASCFSSASAKLLKCDFSSLSSSE